MSDSELKIVIENPKGSFKTFEDEDDDGTYKYPLKGVTYPTDYGFIEGYMGEDGDSLDVFVGSGDLYGSFVVWRYDVPLETKMMMNVTSKEMEEILNEFKPVIRTQTIFKNKEEFEQALAQFKK